MTRTRSTSFGRGLRLLVCCAACVAAAVTWASAASAGRAPFTPAGAPADVRLAARLSGAGNYPNRSIADRAKGLLAFAGSAADPSPPFTQCPAVGVDSSCALLIRITPTGQVGVYGDPSQGPFDEIEDTLIGVQNDSSSSIGSLPVSSQSGKTLFAFDGDGLCTFIICSWDAPTGYEGPDISFTNISADYTSGTIVFSPAIPPGGHTYLSLEEALATVPPFDINPGPPTVSDIHMVALGDSYSSGEGTSPVDNNAAADRCDRGPGAWPRQMQQGVIGISTIVHLACTGAKTADLFDWYKGNPPQLPINGKPDPNIQLVTITIGGNDVGFAKIIRSCYLTFSSCAKVADSPSWKNSLDDLRSELSNDVYPEIRREYPNALIVHAGYPRIMPPPGVTPYKCGWLSAPEQVSAEKMAQTLNDAIAQAVAEYAVSFVDTQIVFAPVRDALSGHELCTPDSWMNPLNPTGALPGRAPEGHPNLRGYQAYGETVATDLGFTLKPGF